MSCNKSTIIFGESKDTLQLKHKTLTMEAKNFFHCSKKIRSNIDLMILGNYESSSSSQPVRTLISRFPFFGEFLPAGEIWTNTSQSTKSTLNKKKCGESVFLSKSWKNIQKVLKCSEFNFWYSIGSTYWVPLEIRSNIYYVQSFACTAFAHHWNIFRTSKYFWRVLKYGQTNPSRIGREVSLPREISLFSFTLWIQRMEEFGKGGRF